MGSNRLGTGHVYDPARAGAILWWAVACPQSLRVSMRCFAISCVVSLVWLAFGYSLVFAPGNGIIGSFDAAFLTGVSEHLTPNGLPAGAFALFQMTFAVITPALIIGAITERARFGFVILFSAIWTALVYVPVAHWVWGGGWLAGLGTIDFAGGIVVHATAGTSALVAAWLVGPRDGFPQRVAPPHNPAMTMAGAGMLWVGWFGFNGGSALAANASAASAILATQFAAAAAGLTWIMIEALAPRRVDLGRNRRRMHRRSGDNHPGLRLCRTNRCGGDRGRRRHPVLVHGRVDQEPARD